MRSAITLGLGILVAAATPGLQAQAKPSAPNSAKSALQDAGKPAQQTAKPAAPAATKPVPQAAKPAAQAAKPAGNPAAKTGAKPATKPAGKTKAAAKRATKKTVEKRSIPGSAPAAAQSEIKQARRDPFESLVGRQNKAGGPNLPPGKLGLQVSTLRLDGIVRAPNGMIAVVSNPQARTYFLREGDRLYDGSVEKILMDSVSFHEEGKDAFGKPVERQVNKRIYSSPGELQ
jgi:Tfp pilus assembly protein PilP